MKRKAAHLRSLISESENEREMAQKENGKADQPKRMVQTIVTTKKKYRKKKFLRR